MAAAKTRGLGKGLEALFNEVEISVSDEDYGDSGEVDRISTIDINAIKPNTNQPRRHFDKQKIGELAESIKAHGVIQPVMVRKAKSGYEIIAGERRWRAARQAGLKQIPCIIRELTDQQNMLISLIENMQREDLNPIEEAQGISQMLSAYGMTQEQVSVSLGKSRPYITNALRLLKLEETIQEMIISGLLTVGHARVIAGIKDQKDQLKVAEKCINQDWSVREIEEYMRGKEKSTPKKKSKARQKRQDILDIEEELKDILGTRVSINLGSKKGRIEIEYYSREELERLIELLSSLKQ